MRTVAIVQARMGSSRLPGKVLADLVGAPMLERQLARIGCACSVDEVVVATTDGAADDPVDAFCRQLGLAVFRGSHSDVLSRYVGAAAMARADIVVRLTADCPLLDGAIIDRVVQALRDEDVDYASNIRPRTYPRGLDVEALTRAALGRCAALATSPAAREHVTWFIHTERPDLFASTSVVSSSDDSDLRWTVDTSEDLAMVRALYSQLGLAERHAPYAEILAWVRAHPDVSSLNALIAQKLT
jgi:spore coat polysaccharide biosynthesis protein SpsF